MNIFFDTSALAKHYINEQGSQQVDEQLSAASNVIVASITKIEILSAISKAHRSNRIRNEEYDRLQTAIHEDFQFFTIVPLNEIIESSAIDGIKNYSLKTLDAIQYASCITRTKDIDKVVVSDRKLIITLERSGLPVTRSGQCAMNIMKILFFSLFLSSFLFSQSPKFEVRAVWISTASGDSPNSTTVEEQQRSLVEMFDLLHKKKFNTVFFQVRPRGNTFYQSAIEPWAQQLTGVLGKNPGWDPLQLAIDEAHQRGMELHAWFNVAKVWGSSDLPSATQHVARVHRNWVKEADGEWWIDMGIPDARAYTERVVMELVKKYDIDGVQFDFIRYPNGGFDDWKTFSQWGDGMERDEWRRNNITAFVRDCYIEIQKEKPWLKVGSAPIGIYQPINGANSSYNGYSGVFQDSRRWLREGIHDYLAPQLYWSIGEQKEPANDPDFEILCHDWAEANYGRHIYAGIGIYRDNVQGEVKDQIEISRQARTQGEAFFRFENLRMVSVMQQIETEYRFPALPPPMIWKDSVPPLPPADITIEQNQNSRTVIRWKEPGPAADGQIPFWYVLYRSLDSTVDTRKAGNLLAVVPSDRQSFRDETAYSTGKDFFYTVTSLDRCGNESISAEKKSGKTIQSVVQPISGYMKPEAAPTLSQNFPEPFTQQTFISYELPVRSFVRIKTHQVDTGRDTVLVSRTQNPGTHILMIDGTLFTEGSIEYQLRVGNATLLKMMEKKIK